MYGTLLSSVPVMIIAFIIGPLSDRYNVLVCYLDKPKQKNNINFEPFPTCVYSDMEER